MFSQCSHNCIFRSVQWFVVFILMSVVAGAQTGSGEKEPLRLGPGDGFRLLVYEKNFLADGARFITNFNNLELFLDGNGDVIVSVLGTFNLAGLTVTEIAALMTDQLRQYAKDPVVQVIPLIRVTLRGEFGRPGMYRFSPNMSFWEMVKDAGGLGSSYELDNVFILRNEEIVYKDFLGALYKAQSLEELGIQSGDEIVAPRMSRLSFETIMRYFQFGSSLILLYFTLTRERK